MIRALLVALAVMVGSWGLLWWLARRLPNGVLKDLLSVIPASVTAVKRLRGDPRVPRSAKVALGFAALWAISPIDLIPEFIPIIGPLDDIVVIALCLRFAARRVPREALDEAWTANPALLDRLIGPRTKPPTQ
jgi:uncharacterized membrane protein YkvA (DUF1232 family)